MVTAPVPIILVLAPVYCTVAAVALAEPMVNPPFTMALTAPLLFSSSVPALTVVRPV
jgi:hypothetical protein